MKKMFAIIVFVMLFASSCGGYQTLRAESLLKWNPVCRHNAVYWATVVQDQGYEVRFMFGKVYEDNIKNKVGGLYREQSPYTWHVQPQVRIGENWYYFKVMGDSIYIIVDMANEFKGWKADYIMSVDQYVHYLFDLEESI